MDNEIEVKLFELLEKASDLLDSVKNVDDDEEEELTMIFHDVENNLEMFIENFFFQLFNNGFELEIEGFTDEDFSTIKDHFSHSKNSIPKNIIDCFEIATDTLLDIETAVYLDPPRDGDLYEAYLDFLPKLFKSFKKDETVLRKHIGNYAKIAVRMEGILARIDKFKKQQKID